MKISTKGRYALSFMLDIVSNENGTPISIKEIAQRQLVSEKYLEHIAGTLLKNGLIRSVRGSNGGYFLTRKADEYTVGEILSVMEGDLAPVSCVQENGNKCDRKSGCMSVILWEKINDAIHSVVDNVTLEDMLSWNQHEN